MWGVKGIKVKWSCYRPGVAQRVGRGIALLFHDGGTRRGEWSAARPCRTLPPGKTRYPLYRRLGGPQGRSGRAESLVLTGIRSRTAQPVVSRYADWATRTHLNMGSKNANINCKTHRTEIRGPRLVAFWESGERCVACWHVKPSHRSSYASCRIK